MSFILSIINMPVMLSVCMLSVFLLIVFMLIVVMLDVVTLSVTALPKPDSIVIFVRKFTEFN